MSHSGWYVTWYVCGQLTFNYHIPNDTWPDAHYGTAEFEKYPEASNWDRMRVNVLRYARRRMRIRVKESFNESFLRLTLWRHVVWRSDVSFPYALTSRFLTLWRHIFTSRPPSHKTQTCQIWIRTLHMNETQKRKKQIRQNSVQVCNTESDKNRFGGWLMLLVKQGHGKNNNRLRFWKDIRLILSLNSHIPARTCSAA